MHYYLLFSMEQNSTILYRSKIKKIIKKKEKLK